MCDNVNMLLDVVKVNQTRFSGFSDDHAKAAAPPTTAAAGNKTSRVEGKKQSVEKRKPHSDSSKEPRPSIISLKDAMDQVSCNKNSSDRMISLKAIPYRI